MVALNQGRRGDGEVEGEIETQAVVEDGGCRPTRATVVGGVIEKRRRLAVVFKTGAWRRRHLSLEDGDDGDDD